MLVNKTIKLSTAQALIKFLSAQKIEIDGKVESLFGCAFAIFGHGNVTCLGQQFEENQTIIPTWRGQNEQSMALAAISYAKANKRQRIGIASSSVGPGATNMVTAAGVAHTNRLPLLLLGGDAFNTRLPDPVLQQVEHFNNPTVTVNDCFKPVTRYWDRITSPEQLLQSLPHAIATLLDPADCGPVFIGLPQDVQGYSYDYPECFFEEKIHRIRRPQPEHYEIEEATRLIMAAKKPLILSGGGVFYSKASEALQRFAQDNNIPVVETIAGRTSLLATDPLNCGPIGPTGSDSANALANQADLIIAVGTRLQDFVTGSWSVFENPDMKLISINTARYDATKHRCVGIMADAKAAIHALEKALAKSSQTETKVAQQDWLVFAEQERRKWLDIVAKRTSVTNDSASALPSYAQIIGQVNELVAKNDRVITAAGGLPAELNMNWLARSRGNFDIEFGFSCMGYEIAAGWGAKIACPEDDVIVLVGDGSYLIMNSDIYSSVLCGHKMIIVVCDNGGFAVINKLQNNTGNTSFNNLLKDCASQRADIATVPKVDFVQHAASLGAKSERIKGAADMAAAMARAKASDVTYVIVVDTDPHQWSSVDSWWEVGIPHVSDREEVNRAREKWDKGRLKQRRGV
ncbi:3D-(3,5/4)-trihydroxycyclohexane-1,2-dione acylhydrolase (decyclizing) [Gammaproteobacteria bacterium AS21]